MKQYKTINDIDTKTDDGKMALAILSQLSCTKEYSNKHPDVILQKCKKVADYIFKNELI